VAEIVEVYGREFEIGKPKTKHYLNLLRFLKLLIQEGYAEKLEELTDMEDVTGFEFFFELVGAIEEEHLAHLSAVLLQGDIDETVAFLDKNGGVELGWLTEAFAINCELADLGRVVENFRRAFAAIRGWRTGTAKD